MAHISGNRTDNVNGSRNCPPSGTHPLDSRRSFKLGSFRDHRLGENFVKTLVCCTRLFWVRKTSHEGFARTSISLSGLEDKFGEVLVPAEEVVEMRAGKKRRSERKFFPGYVLVEMNLDDDSWHLVKETPRVMGFIGGKADEPAPISDAEAEAILRRVQVGTQNVTPKTMFEPGELVRVIDGPFNDFNGVVEEVNYEKNRLHVAVTIFGRSTPVELDFGQVEKG